MNLPFTRSYWVEPGRVLAGCYPGDADPSVAETKLRGLIDCGVSRVINLMEAGEVGHDGRAFVAYDRHLQSLAREQGRQVKCDRFEIVDQSIPSIARMAQILDCIDGARAGGEVVYIHCWGGRGRTGTVVACHLKRVRDLSSVAALSALAELTQHNRQAFWPTPENGRQRAFVNAWKEQP
jgi:protein tyrosine phosphatase